MKMSVRLRPRLEKLIRGLRRFPASAFFALSAAIFLWLWIWDVPLSLPKEAAFYGIVCIHGFFITLAVALYEEGEAKRVGTKHRKILERAVGAVFFVLSYYVLAETATEGIEPFFAPESLLLIAAYGLTVFFAGRFNREQGFVGYALDMLWQIVVAYIFATVLLCGLGLIFFAARILFDIFRADGWLLSIPILCYIPFMAAVFLSNVSPADGEYNSDDDSFSIFESVMNHIMVPILMLYTAVMYIYFAKILIYFELPETSVVNLVLWPSVLGVFVLFFVDHNRDLQLTYLFRRYYPAATLPLLGLMYYAWFLRVSQYGITENRYMVLAVGIWVFFAMVHFILEKREMHVILPQTLVLILLVAALGGPMSARGVAFRSQKGRLESILVRHGMLEGDKLTPSKTVTQEEQREVTEIVSYLHDRHDTGKIPYLRGLDPENNMEKFFGFHALWVGETAIEESLNVTFAAPLGTAIPVAGYDTSYRAESYSTEGAEPYNAAGDFGTVRSKDRIQVFFGKDHSIPLATIDLESVREKLVALSKKSAEISIEDLAIEGETNGYVYKIYFTNLYFNDAAGDIQITDGATFVVLVKTN